MNSFPEEPPEGPWFPEFVIAIRTVLGTGGGVLRSTRGLSGLGAACSSLCLLTALESELVRRRLEEPKLPGVPLSRTILLVSGRGGLCSRLAGGELGSCFGSSLPALLFIALYGSEKVRTCFGGDDPTIDGPSLSKAFVWALNFMGSTISSSELSFKE